MSVTYTSTTGKAVNAGTYVVTVSPGLQVENAIDALDELVGVSLARVTTTAASVPALDAESDIVSSVVPVIIPDSSTVATAGTMTMTAALTTYSGGAWVYLPAGAVVGGTAGLYYAVFSSTTAAQVYTNFVDPATTEFIPYIPTGTLVEAVGSDSAYVTLISTDTPLANITVPANSLSTGSTLETFCRVTCPSAANDKIITHKLGTTSIGTITFTTSTGGTLSTAAFSRTAAQQVLGSQGDSAIAATTFGAVDTTATSKLVITGQLAAVTGYIVLEAFTVRQVTA